jgi:hypothetical protein
LRAAPSADEQQVGDIRAGNQQDQADGAEQHEERGADAAQDPLAQGLQPDGAPLVAVGKVLRLTGGQRREFRARGRHAFAGLQPADDFEVVHVAQRQEIARHVEGRRRHRKRRQHPDPRILRVVERGRHDADLH